MSSSFRTDRRRRRPPERRPASRRGQVEEVSNDNEPRGRHLSKCHRVSLAARQLEPGRSTCSLTALISRDWNLRYESEGGDVRAEQRLSRSRSQSVSAAAAKAKAITFRAGQRARFVQTLRQLARSGSRSGAGAGGALSIVAISARALDQTRSHRVRRLEAMALIMER